MVKFKVIALLIAFVFISQHAQVQRERDNWRVFSVKLEADRAYAALPIALAAAVPHVLGALVVGTGFIYSYTHGGKESIIQFTGAVKDGVALTKGWVQEKIMQRNNISGAPTTDPGTFYGMYDSSNPSVESFIYHGGTQYYVRDYHSSGHVYEWMMDGTIDFNKEPGYVYIRGPVSHYQYDWDPNYTEYKEYPLYWFKKFRLNEVAPGHGDPAPSANPDDYPELFTGPALMSNCHAVAKDNPDITLFGEAPSLIMPDVYDPAFFVTQPVSAITADGQLVDDKGKILPPPPAGVIGQLNPPVLSPDLVGQVPIQTPASDVPQTYVVPQSVADLINSIIAATGTGSVVNGLTNVAGQTGLQWQDAQGQTHSAPLTPAQVTTIGTTIPHVTTAPPPPPSGPQPEQDPGDPMDPAFGAGIFDSGFDWGEKDTYDVAARVSVIEQLPMVNLVKGSSLNLLAANSIINITLSSWPGGPKTLTVDFAQWESIWTAMGAMIYIIAILQSLSLAILGRQL